MASAKTAKAGATKWESRAVLSLIEAGSMAECPHCNERVKFRARHRDNQVICNVYVDGKWDRVEQYHEACYDEIDKPYGDAEKRERVRRRKPSKNDKNGSDSNGSDSNGSDSNSGDSNGTNSSSSAAGSAPANAKDNQ